MVGPLLKFRYTNWKGEEHEYVIEPEGISYSDYPPGEEPKRWQLHGMVVTRDGDPRPQLSHHPGERRRSFLLVGLRDVEEVQV